MVQIWFDSSASVLFVLLAFFFSPSLSSRAPTGLREGFFVGGGGMCIKDLVIFGSGETKEDVLNNEYCTKCLQYRAWGCFSIYIHSHK